MRVAAPPRGSSGGDTVRAVRADAIARTVGVCGTSFGGFHSVHVEGSASKGGTEKAANHDLFAKMGGLALVRSALEGVNGAVIAHGASGAASKDRALGDFTRPCAPNEEGLTLRLLRSLLQEAAAMRSAKASEIEVRMQYLHVRGEEVHDLLAEYDDGDGTPPPPPLDLREDAQGVYAKGATSLSIPTMGKALKALKMGGERCQGRAAPSGHAIVLVHVVRRAIPVVPATGALEEEEEEKNGRTPSLRAVLQRALEHAPASYGVLHSTLMLCDLANGAANHHHQQHQQ